MLFSTNDNYYFYDTLKFLKWRTKGGHPIPIFEKNDIPWTIEERANYHDNKISELKNEISEIDKDIEYFEKYIKKHPNGIYKSELEKKKREKKQKTKQLELRQEKKKQLNKKIEAKKKLAETSSDMTVDYDGTSIQTKKIKPGANYREIKSWSDREAFADKYKSWHDSLTEKELEILDLYKNGEYKATNYLLRNYQESKKNWIPGSVGVQQQKISMLAKAIDKGIIPDDIICYREFNNKELEKVIKSNPKKLIGSTFKDQGFISTTLDPDLNFGGMIKAKIKVPILGRRAEDSDYHNSEAYRSRLRD